MKERREEMDALLVQRATEGLGPEEARRLEQLQSELGGVDSEWVDRVVGELDAESVAAQETALAPELRSALLEAAPAPPSPGVLPLVRPSARVRTAAWGGWAAAAALAVLWLGGRGATTPEAPAATEFATVAAMADAVVLPWAPGGDPSGVEVSGEVAWSSTLQAGVMRFRGLVASAARDFQYQLWIFDAERDSRYPVDGGVFDVPEGVDEIEVPIRARLAVSEATLFAVTVERRGGVVVSDRERIATLAQASG